MISLYDLQKASNGQLFGEPAAQLFASFCFDVQQAAPNTLFVAQRNAQGDTHPDIDEAIRRGVSGVVCHEPPDIDTQNVTVLMVKESVDALLAWARFVIGKQGVRVIAVGGTSGKSIATQAIGTVLSLRHNVHIGDLDQDGRLGLPMSIANMKPDTRFLIVKLSPSAPADMLDLVQSCQPVVGVVTHLDCIHPSNFADCEQLTQEHAKLLEYLSPTDLAVLNFDDDATRQLSTRTRATVKTLGVNSFGADIVALSVVSGLDRIGFDVRYGDERIVGRWSPVLGKHQLYGLLAGALVGAHFGVPITDGLKSLTEILPLNGRMKPLFGKNGSIIVDDTFRANTSSTLSALDWLSEIKTDGQRLIFVMGDMDNLGASSMYGHRLVGAKAAETVDFIITLGKESAQVGRAAIDQQMLPKFIRTTYGVQDVLGALDALSINSDDVILVKGGAESGIEAVVRGLLADNADVLHLVRQEERVQAMSRSLRTLRPSWLEIDSDALAQNVRVIRDGLASDVTMMAIVKAEGYGHGAVLTARTALANGAEFIGVANMAEAITLRDSGITAPILVLTYLPPHAVRQAIVESITATVYDLTSAQQYDRMARANNARLKVHLKVDSGMGRLGVLQSEALGMFRHLITLKNLDVEGIYTHFASADDSPEFTQKQLETFKSILRAVRASGFQFKYVHAANSPATLLDSQLHFNMVRTGVMMYGLASSQLVPMPEGIHPVMSWKTTVLQVKALPPNSPVGYGRTYYTTDHEKIAILPVGYADGLRRSPKTWREVLIRGQRAPIVGRVSMEKCAINITHIPNVSAGDEVVLLGAQGNDRITAEEIGDWLGTINYEVVTSLRHVL